MPIRQEYQRPAPLAPQQMAQPASVIQEGPSAGGALAGMLGKEVGGALLNKGITAGLTQAAGTAALGPLAPLAGLLLNKGGKVNRFGRAVTKPARTKTSAQGGGWWGKLFQKKNDGGMIQPMALNKGGMAGPLNPHGYNEGGAVTETPIKKVMDEQKLDQQAVAFERDEARKDEKHTLDMKLKQQQFAMAQKMKKEASTTTKKPAKPASAPLSKK